MKTGFFCFCKRFGGNLFSTKVVDNRKCIGDFLPFQFEGKKLDVSLEDSNLAFVVLQGLVDRLVYTFGGILEG